MSHHPVDHGFAWVICFATGVQSFFVVGGLKSMGILFVTLVDIFDASPSLTSVTLGLTAGGFAIFALLSTALSAMFGHRLVSVCGSILCAFAAFMSMWAVNIVYVIIFLGLLSGLAYGAMATPAVVLLNSYFDERKSLANGLAMVGSSIGQLSLPYLITFLVDYYGYRGAMLLYSGICMQAIPASLLLFPTSFWTPKKVSADTVEAAPMKTPLSASCTSVHSRASTLRGSKASLKQKSTIHASTGSIMLGLSVENLAQSIQGEEDAPPAKKPTFCQVLFDPELIRSKTMWLLFCAVGIGHAGFIDACLFLPALAYDLFNDKYRGAFLIFIIGAFDIVGRIGGGWFADLGLINRVYLTAIAMTITGSATLFLMFHPIFEILIFYSIIMGVVGGVYRILLPVLIKDLFGAAKISSGVGLGYLSMGVFILPVPSLLGYMKQVYDSYIPAMKLCGALLIFGGTLMFTLPTLKRYEDKRSGIYEITGPDGHPVTGDNVSLVLDVTPEQLENIPETVATATDDMTEADIADVKM